MAIDISALSAFRHVATWVDDSVANVAYGNEIWSPGLYEGKFKAAFSSRSQSVKDANNAVRTALLKALGNACGLAYGEGDRFSEDFMNRLQQLIGKDFNRRIEARNIVWRLRATTKAGRACRIACGDLRRLHRAWT